MPAYRKPTAVVVSRDGVFYDHGGRGPLTIGLGPELRLTEVLRGAEQLFMGGEGVVMVDATLAEAEASLPELVGNSEWKFKSLRPWTTLARGYANRTGTVIHLGLWGEVVKNPGPLFEQTQGPADVAHRLGRYHQVTGHHWRATAGVSGCYGLRSRHTRPGPGAQPLWKSPGPKGILGAGPLIWLAAEQPVTPPLFGWSDEVHPFDVNAMYLGGLKNASLAWGALQETGDIGFHDKKAGWWEIDVAGIPAELYDGKVMPPLFPAVRIHHGAVWLSTETVKLCADMGSHIDVLNSWTSDNVETIGRSYAERLISARAGMLGPLGPGVDFALKRTYAELVGMMAREGGSIERSDWAATVMDLSRANMLRRVYRVGRQLGAWPVAIRTDAVYYARTDQMDPTVVATALGIGTGVGMFKKMPVLTVADYRAKFSLDGRK